MKINVMGDKGGVGKSVTAVHLGAVLGLRFGVSTTAVVDADPNGSIVRWRDRARERETGEESGWPFEVMGLEDGDGWARYENVVFDSQGRPSSEDLRVAVEASDLIVVPTTTEGLAVNTLVPFVEAVEEAGGRERYMVLITMVPWWNRSAARCATVGGRVYRRSGVRCAVDRPSTPRPCRVAWCTTPTVGAGRLRDYEE